MIAHADAPKPPALVRHHVKGRYVFVLKGSNWNGFYRVRVWCTLSSCGPATLNDLSSEGFASS